MVATTLQNEETRAEAQSAELNEAGRAYRLLGGGKILKQPVRNSLDAHDLIMKGLSSGALVHLVSNVTILSSGMR